MQYDKVIGIIVPSSGIMTEMLFHKYAPPHIGISTARVKFNKVSFQDLSDMLTMVGQAAEDLCRAEPNIMVFSSVMGGAINGRSITNIVEQSTGTPCITGFYAILEAVEALNIKHPAVLSPYNDQLNLVFKRKMLQNDIQIQNIFPFQKQNTSESIRTLEEINIQDIYSALKNVDLSGSDALIINIACINGLDNIRELEKDLGIPVIVGDQVSLWSALRSINDKTVIPELGKIFEV